MAVKKCISKNGKLSWEAGFYVNGRGSKYIRRRFDKKIDAQKYIDNYGIQIEFSEDPLFINNMSEITFLNESQFWLQQQKSNFSNKQYKRVKDIVEKLLPLVGSTMLINFNPTFLYNLRNELSGPDGLKGKNGKIKNSSINRWITVVKTIINFSYLNQRISRNPCIGFKMLKEVNSEIRFWSKNEASQFLEFAKNKYSDHPNKRWVYLAYLISLNTGIRAGELWGLKKDDFKKNNVINISRQWLSESKCFGPTKGNKTRLVPLNEKVKNEFDNLTKKFETNELKNTLFQTSKGSPINHANFRKRSFIRDLIESGIRPIRFHDLRHTALSLMVSQGIDIRTVQAIGGHADIKTTMGYVHLIGQNIINVADSFSITND